MHNIKQILQIYTVVSRKNVDMHLGKLTRQKDNTLFRSRLKRNYLIIKSSSYLKSETDNLNNIREEDIHAPKDQYANY